MANNEKMYARQLSMSYWFVTHKLLLKNIFLVILIIFIVFLVALDLYLLVFNFGLYAKPYQAILDSFTSTSSDYIKLRQAKLPQPIVISQISTFQNTRGYDILADINNSNSTWYAVFSYQFQIGDKLTNKRQSFILPGESKKIIDLAVENGNLASQLVFSDVVWEKELNFVKIAEEKLKIEIPEKDITYIPAQQLGVTEKIQVNRVKFNAANKSAFNYQNVIFQIYLKAGDNIIGVNQLASGPWYSGEAKDFEVNFFQTLPRITGVNVTPEINILDDKSFIKF